MEESDELAECFHEPPAISTYTPWAGKRKVESLSPDSEEYDYYDSAFATDVPTKLLGSTPDEQLKTICNKWGNMVQNTNLLWQLIGSVHNKVQMNKEKVVTGLADVEFSVAMLVGINIRSCEN